MNCVNHSQAPAVGICSVCQKAVCRTCVGRDTPRLVCQGCLSRGGVRYGFEYRSAITVGSWPLVHVCGGIDPVTQRPTVARGVIAIGNIAVGAVALGGVALGMIALGGLSVGLLLALGGGAIGVGFSMGGLAVGSIAVGGLAVGFRAAVGGAAFGPAVIDGRRCDRAALEYVRIWFGSNLPPSCQ